jgi:hypothetical protein
MSAPSKKLRTVRIVAAVLIAAFTAVSAGCSRPASPPAPVEPPFTFTQPGN